MWVEPLLRMRTQGTDVTLSHISFNKYLYGTCAKPRIMEDPRNTKTDTVKSLYSRNHSLGMDICSNSQDISLDAHWLPQNWSSSLSSALHDDFLLRHSRRSSRADPSPGSWHTRGRPGLSLWLLDLAWHIPSQCMLLRNKSANDNSDLSLSHFLSPLLHTSKFLWLSKKGSKNHLDCKKNLSFSMIQCGLI